jgi:hypothetical protein
MKKCCDMDDDFDVALWKICKRVDKKNQLIVVNPISMSIGHKEKR